MICHSIPSPIIFSDYLRFVGGNYDKRITALNLKDKSLGWPKTSTYYKFEDSTEVFNPKGLRCWQDIFESGYITRPSCFDCRYTNLHRPGDITIGDFWDFDGLRPDLRSVLGTSVLLVNSEKGRDIINEIHEDIQLWSISKKEAMQPRLERPSIKPKQYEKFWDDYRSKGYKYVYRRYFTISLLKRVKVKLRRFLRI